MRDRVALALTALTAALHLAVANRYDLFRDELYFIVCGRHPAFGYADQPPLVPLLAAGTYALGGQTWLVRLPAVLAAAALVWLVVAFVRLLGGRNGAAWAGGIAAAIAPMLMGLTATLNTTAFEPLAWTLVAYGLARAVLLDDRRALLWTGLVAGIAMEAKYALPLWLLALAIGAALFPQRVLFRRRELWFGLGIAAIVALPSLVWQSLHGWPFVELVHNAAEKDLAVGPLRFFLNQILVFNAVLAPLWIAGLVAPFIARDLRAVRFIPIAWAIAAFAIIAGGGKDYYLAPAYPALFALGAVVFERTIHSVTLRAAYLAVAAANSFLIAPIALPILAPQSLVSYQTALHLAPAPQERGDTGDRLPSTFADMLGWHDFVREVGTAYDALPAAERARTAIFTDNYGEAAALDLYGAPYHLPPALSGHNQYYFWGLRGQHPANVVSIQDDPASLRPYCERVRVMGITRSRYARDFENGKTIAFCRGVHPSLATLWPKLNHFI
ncbi:MAG: glycosyltransferase family 39 protein [Vulcanimicrobiaceae bacterium]